MDDDGSLEVKVRVEFVELDSKREHASNDDSNQGDSEVCIAFAPHGPWKSIDARVWNAAQIIDIAMSRGAFRANEAAQVGAVYNKIETFIKSVAETQNQNAEASASQ